MSLTPTQLLELQTIVLDLGEEFPHNADALWNAAIRIQVGGLGPTSGAGGQPAFDAAVADIKVCQEAVQTYQQRQGSPNSGFDVAVLQVVPATSTFPTGNVGEILYLQTAPNSYVATDQIVIDPAGPNSVQMDEVGTPVFRTVPPASGGIEINNLSTGAGFERVLTTADLTVMGGQVDSVVGGVNISVNAADPVNPIVNLDAAITGVSVNAVTLSAVGAATNFLDETGAYSIPPAGVPDGATDGDMLYWDQSGTQAYLVTDRMTWDEANQTLLLGQNDRVVIDGLADGGSGGQVRVTKGATTSFVTAAFYIPTITGNKWLFGASSTDDADEFGIQWNLSSSDGNETVNFGWLTFPGGSPLRFQNNGSIFIAGDSFILNTGAMYLEERASAGGDVATYGQFWVSDAATQVPMFTDEAGVDTVLNLGGGLALPTGTVEGANLYWDDTGGAWVENTIVRFNVTGDVFEVYSPGDLTKFITLDWRTDFNPRFDLGANETGGAADFIYNSQLNMQSSLSSNAVANTVRIHSGMNTIASNIEIGHAVTFGFIFTDASIGGTIDMRAQNGALNIRLIDGSGLMIEEKAAALADTAAFGQFWVRNDVPNTPMFTDDTGVDFVLNAGLTQPITLTADIDGDGFNLDDMGVIFMREQAAADADVTGQGQIWVLDEGFTQSLMYTNDNGNDFELAALNLTDMNTANIVIAGTTFVECLVCQPDINRDYMVTAVFEVTSPATDDVQVQMVIDTNAVFKGIISWAGGGGNGEAAFDSATGEVITNNVVIPTDGTASPNGTYITITGCLRMGATSGTHSVRVRKDADVGADGRFESTAALQLLVLQVS